MIYVLKSVFLYLIILQLFAHKRKESTSSALQHALARIEIIHMDIYVCREFIRRIDYRYSQSAAARVVVALRMLVINAVRPLSHARAPSLLLLPFFAPSIFVHLAADTRSLA